MDWKQQSGGSNLRPRITLGDEKGEVINLPNGLEARYFMSMNAVLSVENKSKVKAGSVLARIPREVPRQEILQVDCQELLNFSKLGSQKTLQLFPKVTVL